MLGGILNLYVHPEKYQQEAKLTRLNQNYLLTDLEKSDRS
jgi:hypothetical protein